MDLPPRMRTRELSLLKPTSVSRASLMVPKEVSCLVVKLMKLPNSLHQPLWEMWNPTIPWWASLYPVSFQLDTELLTHPTSPERYLGLYYLSFRWKIWTRLLHSSTLGTRGYTIVGYYHLTRCHILDRDHPLALYVFSQDAEFKAKGLPSSLIKMTLLDFTLRSLQEYSEWGSDRQWNGYPSRRSVSLRFSLLWTITHIRSNSQLTDCPSEVPVLADVGWLLSVLRYTVYLRWPTRWCPHRKIHIWYIHASTVVARLAELVIRS